MDIKLELLSNAVSELVMQRLDTISIDADKIADTVAIAMLSEIQKIIQDDEISDFDAVEKIVVLFEKYGIDAGIRHDFGWVYT